MDTPFSDEVLPDADGTSDGTDSEGIPASLVRAAASWIRRGYRVHYTDPYLMQLLRRDRPRGGSLLLLVCAALALVVAAVAFTAGLRRRTWHVVSIATGPDGRILTHAQRSPKPPPTE